MVEKAASAKVANDALIAPTPWSWKSATRLFVLALVVRIVFNRLMVFGTTGGDMFFYLGTASNILHHGTFSISEAPPYEPSTYRAPLFPSFIALVEKVSGESLGHVQVAQCLLSATAVVLLWRAVSTISPRAGTFVGFAMALCPFDAAYASAYLSESLVTFFLVVGTSVLFITKSSWKWAASGVAFALAALTRDAYMLLFPGLAAFAVIHKTFDSRKLTQRVVGPLMLIVAGMATIAPWTIRNYEQTHHFIPISRSVLARALWFGTWVKDDEHVRNDPTGKHLAVPEWAFHLPGEKEKFDTWKLSTDEAARDRVFMRMFIDRFEAEPATVMVAWFRRTPKLWIGSSRLDLWEFRPSFLARGKPLYVVMKGSVFLLNILMFALALFATLICLRRWARPWLFFTMPIMYTVALFLPLDGLEPRYSEPVVPFMIVMIAYLFDGPRARALTQKIPWFRPKPALAE